MSHTPTSKDDLGSVAKSPDTPEGKDLGMATTLVKEMEKLGLSDYMVWPDAWKDEDENSGVKGANLDALLADAHSRETYWESLGVPCRRVILDANGDPKFQSRQWVSFYAAESKNHDDQLDTEYVAMSRDAPPDQTSSATVYVDLGKEVKGVNWVIVPMSEVPRLQDEGWTLWFAPSPALDVEKGYNDVRKVDKPVDVLSTDKPAKDSAHFLDVGNKFVAANMTKGKWSHGQLIGENGSKPETIAKSPTHAPFTPENEWEERRSVTSTGHVTQHRRPAGVGLGWGGYDQFSTWESYGRRVTPDMVEQDEGWSTNRLGPINLVDDEGKVIRQVTIPFDEADLPPVRFPPKSLYDLLHPEDTSEVVSKTPEAGNTGTMKWAGTTKDNR